MAEEVIVSAVYLLKAQTQNSLPKDARHFLLSLSPACCIPSHLGSRFLNPNALGNMVPIIWTSYNPHFLFIQDMAPVAHYFRDLVTIFWTVSAPGPCLSLLSLDIQIQQMGPPTHDNHWNHQFHPSWCTPGWAQISLYTQQFYKVVSVSLIYISRFYKVVSASLIYISEDWVSEKW